MNAHVTLSPSRRPRFGACPGSVREEARYPDEPSGQAAAEGTHDHTLLEHCIKTLTDPLTLVGTSMTDHEGNFMIDRERAARVNVAWEYVQSKTTADKNAVVYSETRVDPRSLVHRQDMSGTVDIQIHTYGAVEVIDYKGGMAPVEPDDPQLQQYAVGVLAQHFFSLEQFTLTVIQPKLTLKGLPAIRSKSFTKRDVLGWVEDLIREGHAVDAPDAPLVPGERQCKYCKHRTACSARAQTAMNAVGMMFGSVEKPVETQVQSVPAVGELSQQAAARDPATMTGQQIREALEAAPLIRQFLEGVEKEAEKRLTAGQSVPGLKLVNGRGSRKWNLDDEQIVEKLKGMGIPKDACYTVKVISPGQAEKVTWTKRDGTTMQLTERQLKRMDQEYVTHMTGKFTVALEADSRPAVTTDVSDMFAAVAAPAEVVPDFLQTPDWLK